jgi:hypothetical protein
MTVVTAFSHERRVEECRRYSTPLHRIEVDGQLHDPGHFTPERVPDTNCEKAGPYTVKGGASGPFGPGFIPRGGPSIISFN